ncbi:hypothetical protein BDM02DRAFT_1843202 [Thelephora ganbajun]|uniref:Uncharacterized protein n=1 Tax=Thelephora ganbajun TaxID=370292 RepID=A0ACB6ZIR2_THEGA|nr:hypothetical protein BDM02DRAFT_1843202 [Thelephora ganbajun]
MPKSKRAKVVSLTKVAKKTRQQKEGLITDVQANIDKWKYCWLFEVGNMRNGHLKTIRKLWKDSGRTFFGRGAVMAKGLGNTIEEEHLPGLHRLSQHIKGQVGLFFTDSPPDEVTTWFDDFHPPDFARAGIRAPKTVIISAGAVTQHHSDPPEPMPHNEEPQLRKLGLTTRMNRGVPTLDVPHKICEQGKKLTPEQSQLLKLLGYKTVEFKIKLLGRWEKETGNVTMEPATEHNSQPNGSNSEGEDDDEDTSD